LMAWIRTSTSLISFGFTIYKFFEYLVQTNLVDRPPHRFFGPRSFALCMISVGVTALATAVIDYQHTLKILEREHGAKYRSLAGKVAGGMFFFGMGVLIVVLFRWWFGRWSLVFLSTVQFRIAYGSECPIVQRIAGGQQKSPGLPACYAQPAGRPRRRRPTMYGLLLA